MEDEERWSVLVRDRFTGTWHTDTSDRVFYPSHKEAMDWALKLRTIHEHVALKHEMITHEELA